MLVKAIIILFLFIILYCLGSGLYYLVKDGKSSDKMVAALGWRIGLSVVLFLLLFVAFAFGWIHPHGL